MAAYRILQEALTNVIKHAGPVPVRLVIEQDAAGLTLDVTNTTANPALLIGAEGAGLGIPGMRERAAAVGGLLEAGPLPGGGFRVHAALPARGKRA
jgi:signal transduction histidine kinase